MGPAHINIAASLLTVTIRIMLSLVVNLCRIPIRPRPSLKSDCHSTGHPHGFSPRHSSASTSSIAARSLCRLWNRNDRKRRDNRKRLDSAGNTRRSRAIREADYFQMPADVHIFIKTHHYAHLFCPTTLYFFPDLNRMSYSQSKTKINCLRYL